MGRKIPRDKRLLMAKEMPKLFRKKPGATYSFKNDEVLKWLSERPGIMDYVLNKITAAGYIVYDPDTEMWQGVNHED